MRTNHETNDSMNLSRCSQTSAVVDAAKLSMLVLKKPQPDTFRPQGFNHKPLHSLHTSACIAPVHRVANPKPPLNDK
jgi:hypothetical protein